MHYPDVDTTLHLLPRDTRTFKVPLLDADDVEVKNETGDALMVQVQRIREAGCDRVLVTARRPT